MSSSGPLVSSGWRPTAALVRAGLLSSTLAALAAGTGRPDLLVLAIPFLAHTALALSRTPRFEPQVRTRLGHRTLREGEGTTVEVVLEDAEAVEHAVISLDADATLAARPASGVAGATRAAGSNRSAMAQGAPLALSLDLASLRWGHRLVGAGVVGGTDAWAARRWGPVRLAPTMLTTLPLPGLFDSQAPVPHPVGLVGQHPSRRPGDGSEFSGIRPFQTGDRLRRVHWRVTLRTQKLHVTSTVAEQDSSVVLVVDAGVDLGVSHGIHGSASTLDVAVRAAGALAEYYLHQGDRVGLRVLGSRELAVPVAGGRRHLRRVLETLARVTPGEGQPLQVERLLLGVPTGAVAVVFSPMLSEAVATTTALLARSQGTVVVADTLPDDLRGPDWDPVALGGEARDRRRVIAWRMRLLERDQLLGRLARAGVPVVAWAGPGTLDTVLRGLAARLRTPRAVR